MADTISTPDGAYRLQWGVRLPLRDGVQLNATLYLSPQQAEPVPAVVTMTPYISDTYHERGRYFAQHGYIFVIVDVRGRGSSEGVFEPFLHMSEDGYDVVEWIAAQPWCNGKVGMWGGSYAGQNQWATLKARPPHLTTIAPAAAVHLGVDFPGLHNIFYAYNIQWLTFTGGRTPNANLFQDDAFWEDKFKQLFLEHRPFRELDTLVGNPSAAFQHWLSHPEAPAYWNQFLPSAADYAAFDIPILTITGHFDGDQPGALHYYRQHMHHGTAAAIASHYLILGPYDHAGTRTPKRQVGGLTFGEAALLDLNALHQEWYDWTMKGGERPAFLQQRVAYYVVGQEKWRYADSLEAIGATPRRYYLLAGADPRPDVFHSGHLVETRHNSPPLAYVYDPLDTRSAERDAQPEPDYLLSQRLPLALEGDGLIFHSAPLSQAVTMVGWLRLVAWISLDTPDTDFYAGVYEITTTGQSIKLGDALLRARYRHSLVEPQLVTPGVIERYEFDTFWFHARELARGSRLRLVVTAPNTFHLMKNYNSGGVVAEETAADARTAHVTLYADAEHPSYLELPLLPTSQPA